MDHFENVEFSFFSFFSTCAEKEMFSILDFFHFLIAGEKRSFSILGCFHFWLLKIKCFHSRAGSQNDQSSAFGLRGPASLSCLASP